MSNVLSKSEIEYLKGLKNVSKGYERYLRHSINKKLSKFEEQILPTILNNETTRSWFINLVRRNTNAVRENTNNILTQENLNSDSFIKNRHEFIGGCGLAWSRTGASQASNPGSNPGSRTKPSLEEGFTQESVLFGLLLPSMRCIMSLRPFSQTFEIFKP